MIEVESVSKGYGDHTVVSDASFTVARGETLVLLGTSGSGKTTILKMINRLIDPDSGSIRVDGEDVKGVEPEGLRRKMGYVIQQSGLFPHYSIEENIGLVPTLVGWSANDIKQRVKELIGVVGLSDQHLERYPHELSGGQQQRVGIARALAADPPVILMDEPFGALDPITKQQMTHEFASLGMLREKTVVLVTHDVLEAFTLGDHICLLDQGKVQQLGTPKELLFSPKNEFVRSFFRAQQLRLGLEVVTVKDIIKPSPEDVSTGSSDKNTIKISASASIFEVLDQFDEKSVSQVVIEREQEDLVLDRYQLLQWFFDYQQRQG